MASTTSQLPSQHMRLRSHGGPIARDVLPQIMFTCTPPSSLFASLLLVRDRIMFTCTPPSSLFASLMLVRECNPT